MKGNYGVYTALKVPGMSSGYVEIGPVCESCSVIESNLVSSVFPSWCLLCCSVCMHELLLYTGHFLAVILVHCLTESGEASKPFRLTIPQGQHCHTLCSVPVPCWLPSGMAMQETSKLMWYQF
jgi:hypothetical protein